MLAALCACSDSGTSAVSGATGSSQSNAGAVSECSSDNSGAAMAVAELKDYLEFGVVRNSVNFPPLDSFPHAEVKSRVVVINQDVPNMIAEITKVFSAANINIASFSNKSNGKIGYNLIDVESTVDDSIVENLSKLDKVIRVRVIRF